MNILAETSIDQKKAIKAFRVHALLKAKVIETKSITIQKKKYRIIGQQLISSPLFSHFEVVNADGVRANDSIEEEVYSYISMLQIINHFRQIKPWLKEQSNYAKNIDLAPTKDSLHQSAKEIIEESTHLLELFNTLDEKAVSLFERSDWTDKQFTKLNGVWDAFWGEYEKRLNKLFEFHTYVLNNQTIKKVEKTGLQSVYKEAYFSVHLFKETIPLYAPFTLHINDFITLNGQLGKRSESMQMQELIHKKERFSFHFFKAMLYTLLFIQVVVSVLTFLDVIHFISVITAFILVLLIFYFGYVNDRELLKTIETRLKTYRREQLSTVPIIRKKYNQQFTTYIQKEQRKKRNEKPYEYYASIANVPTWFMFFGIATIILGLMFFMVDNGPSLLPVIYLMVGVLLTVIGIYLPGISLGRRKIVLSPGKLSIQKKTYAAEDITRVRMHPSHKQLLLYVTSRPDPMKFNIAKDHRDEVQLNLFKWCERNYVTYEIKS